MTEEKYIPNKKVLEARIPDFTGKINLNEFIETTHNKLQEGLVGIYVPLDEQFEKGISSLDEKVQTSWASANPFKALFARLNEDSKPLIKDAFYKALVKAIPDSYFPKKNNK
jgi:hypothetical protein